MKKIAINLIWGLFLFLAGLAFKFYNDYQSAVHKAIEAQRKLDSLQLEKIIIEVRDTVFVPDTVYQTFIVEKEVHKIVKDTVLIPLILTDTIYVEKELPYFRSQKYYSDKFIDANILAFARSPVDSFQFGYNLKMSAIAREAKLKIEVDKKCKQSWWQLIEHGALIGFGTYFILNQWGK